MPLPVIKAMLNECHRLLAPGAYFEGQAAFAAEHGLTWSLISSTVGTTATVIEPLI